MEVKDIMNWPDNSNKDSVVELSRHSNETILLTDSDSTPSPLVPSPNWTEELFARCFVVKSCYVNLGHWIDE
jgi:hypothetical protein